MTAAFDSGAFESSAFELAGGASNTPINPGAGSIAVTGYAPSIARTNHQTVAPAVGGLVVTGYAPSIAQTAASGATVSPAVGTLALVGYAPTITRTAHQSVAPARGLVVTTGYAPTIYQGLPAVTPNECAATIMRESIINGEVTALLDRIAAQAGTMSDTLNSATVMRTNAVNNTGAMRGTLNQIAELL